MITYATDRKEVRNDKTMKDSYSAHTVKTLNLFLSDDGDIKTRNPSIFRILKQPCSLNR